MISWVNFAIPSYGDWLIGHLTMIGAIFLVLITIFTSSIQTLPAAEGPHALNVWMICCILFVLGVLIQSTFITLKFK